VTERARFQQGNALPETIAVSAILLLVVFAAVNVALLGYLQAEADGAAYAGARKLAAAPIAGPSAQASVAASALQKIFPYVKTSAVTAAQGTNSAGVVVSLTGPGLPLLGGASRAATAISGHAFEPFVNATPSANGRDVLLPVVSAVVSPQGENYAIWLAQDSGSNSNRWGEFACHQGYLDKISFPSTLAAAQNHKEDYLTNVSKTFEYPIYQWDSSHTCS
jgi:Flp pilus assembly protein TadG